MSYSPTGICQRALLLLALAFSLSPLQAVHAQDVTENVSVNLAWDPNTEPNIAGYKLYSRTVYTTYGSGTDLGNVTATTVPDLPSGNVYYFKVTAYNTQGIESQPSSEVLYIALHPPTPTPTPTTPTPTQPNASR